MWTQPPQLLYKYPTNGFLLTPKIEHANIKKVCNNSNNWNSLFIIFKMLSIKYNIDV